MKIELILWYSNENAYHQLAGNYPNQLLKAGQKMQWDLPTGTQPPYQKIIQLINTALQAGTLLPGQQLPPERQLAKQLNVNRSTVQHAFNELVSRGILERRVGSGTWVNSGKWGVLSQKVDWQSYLTANRLSDPDNYMVRLRQLDGQPRVINLAHSSIGADLALPVEMTALSGNQLVAQERHVNISGADELKEQLIRHLTGYLAQSVTPDQLLITSGAQQAFYLIAQGLLQFGDAIAIEKPSYFYQLSLFQAAGIRVLGIPLGTDGSLDLDELQHLYYRHHLRFLFVNPTGQNPTGQTMPLKARRALIAKCQELKLPIVEDDPLGMNLALTGSSIKTLKSLDPDNVLYIGSLSSLIGANARIGWLIAPPQLVDRLANIRQEMESGISIFPQLVASQFLKAPNLSHQLEHQNAQLASRFQNLRQALAPFESTGRLTYHRPANGNNLWVTLLMPNTLLPSDYTIFLANDLLVRPGFLFGVNQNQLRLSFTNFTDDLVTALTQKWARVMDQLLTTER